MGVEKSIEELRSALSSATGQESGAGQAANKLAIEQLAADLKSLDQRIAEAAAAATAPADTSALDTRLNALQAEIGALKTQQNELATRTRSALGEAYARLAGKAAGSAPFGNELDALVAEAPAIAGVDTLRALAADGVASTGELAQELQKIAGDIAAAKTEAAAAKAEDGGMLGQLTAKLSSVVKVRKLDEADWPAALNTAAGLIGDGELGKAVDLVAAQPGETPEAVAAWQAKAGNRLKVQKALDQVSRAVLSRLAAGGQSG
jgi:hypothetical protein